MDSIPENYIVVALDIGTSKVVCLVASVSLDGSIEVIGIGNQPSKGLKRGVVVDIESTGNAIQRAVEEAELMADCHIHSVTVGLAGAHISSFSSDSHVKVRDREVVEYDLERVVEAAEAVSIPVDQKIIHVLPQEYIIDGQEGIRDPLGMSGVRLEAKMHLVKASVNAVQNIEKCIKRCNLEVDNIVLGPLASSYSVLTEDEKDLGVCLVDIGGGTADIAIFASGSIRHTAIIPIAGDQVTNDIAMALRTPTASADEIKIKYACALTQLTQAEDLINVPSVGGRPARSLSRQELAEVVEPRYEELFRFIANELKRSGFEDFVAAGLVITGGTSQMEGAIELAEQLFNMPVRLAAPKGVCGMEDTLSNPIYATSLGLLICARDEQNLGASNSLNRDQSEVAQQEEISILDRIKAWFKNEY